MWASLALAFGSVIAAFAVLGATQYWFPPMTLLFTSLVAYPLWSWRRLEAATRYLDEELERLRAESGSPATSRRSGSDYLEDRIGAVQGAVARLRSARRLIVDSLDGLPDAAFVTTLKGDIALANRNAVELCGKDVSGKGLAAALAPLQPRTGAWEDTVRAALAGEGRLMDARSAQGREYVARIAPFRDGDNAVAGCIAVIEDVTELRFAERDREETLAFVSHDLRSPQASILALTELQRLGAGTPVPDFIARIEQLAWKTVTLAEDFVHLTRADSKLLPAEPFDLAEAVDSCVLDIAPQATAKGIVIEHPAPAAPVPLQADRALVSRAITNLVSNAIKYSAANTRVTITTETHDGYAVCTVSDQGVGISEKDKQRLFQAFARIESAGRATRAQGIGLGLVFVETVARRHGGRVTLESTPGVGSSFALWLPAAPRPEI